MTLKPISTAIAPRPVHPTAIRNHGLFGITFVRGHVITDKLWEMSALTKQFESMGTLLSRHGQFKRLESKVTRRRLRQVHRTLRRECRDGRAKLQLILFGDNAKQVRNYLINRKDMQRLYQKMPVHQALDNINQRTFVMRKERDRLQYRLDKMKDLYMRKLWERETVNIRIKYEDEFVLDEEIQSRVFLNKIAKSALRLNAVRTINVTYRKMLQVLKHDAIFYEPILRSLTKDAEDQANFIKHILYIGMPSIAKYAELSEEYRYHVTRLHNLPEYRNSVPLATSLSKLGIHEPEAVVIPAGQRYVRETPSMNVLKHQLETVETTIKRVKFATLSSQAKEIFPRIKSALENNLRLNKSLQREILGLADMETKLKRASVLEGVLLHSLSEEEIERLQRIKDLKAAIKAEDEREAEDLRYMKARAVAFVLLRHTMWHLCDIVQYVDKPLRWGQMKYTESYLHLPLLKFEMLTMKAVAPPVFQEKLDDIMHHLKKKMQILMKAFDSAPPSKRGKIRDYINQYYNDFIQKRLLREDSIDEEAEDVEEDLLQEAKNALNVPNRKQIKTISAKLVEELSKKED